MMLNGMAILLFCQLLGEVIVRLFGWPMPGPVLGMLLLLGALMLRKRSSHDLDLTADGLLKYLALLFVPAGVGVMVYLDMIGKAWLALAVPLYRQLPRLKTIRLPVTVSLGVGVVTGAFSAVLIGCLLGLDQTILVSLAPKSVTTPVAMGISEALGGIPALTAAFVAFTGIAGAVIGLRVLKMAGVSDESAVGIAMGVAAHGVGTARAFEHHPVSGAIAGLAMALAAFETAIVLPVLFERIGWL